MSKYPLIIFEGIEGSGKTTQINKVIKYLKKNRKKFIKFREPGGSKNSEKIRSLILDRNIRFKPFTDLLLYLASRNENVDKILKRYYGKKIIIIDRFIYSTIAYQHYGMKINRNIINTLNNYILGKIKPDFIFLHKVNMVNLKKRLSQRKRKNRYDKFNFKFYSRVQRGFLSLLKHKKNVMVVDSNKNIDEISNQIISKINIIIK